MSKAYRRPDGDQHYTLENKAKTRERACSFGGGLAAFNRAVGAKKLPVEVIQDLSPLTEHPAWDPKWCLQLRAEIRSRKVGMWGTPQGRLLVSHSADVPHSCVCVAHHGSVRLEQDCHTVVTTATPACLRLGEVPVAIWKRSWRGVSK